MEQRAENKEITLDNTGKREILDSNNLSPKQTDLAEKLCRRVIDTSLKTEKE